MPESAVTVFVFMAFLDVVLVLADLLWEFHGSNQNPRILYRVSHFSRATGMGWIEFDFECCSVCPILPDLLEFWQELLIN